MTHGSKLFQRERLPTVSEIVEVIRTMPYEVERCVEYGYKVVGGRATYIIDLNEVFIEVMGVWLDFDGRRYSADRARGHAYPGWFGAWRLRRALRPIIRQRGWKGRPK